MSKFNDTEKANMLREKTVQSSGNTIIPILFFKIINFTGWKKCTTN